MVEALQSLFAFSGCPLIWSIGWSGQLSPLEYLGLSVAGVMGLCQQDYLHAPCQTVAVILGLRLSSVERHTISSCPAVNHLPMSWGLACWSRRR